MIRRLAAVEILILCILCMRWLAVTLHWSALAHGEYDGQHIIQDSNYASVSECIPIFIRFFVCLFVDNDNKSDNQTKFRILDCVNDSVCPAVHQTQNRIRENFDVIGMPPINNPLKKVWRKMQTPIKANERSRTYIVYIVDDANDARRHTQSRIFWNKQTKQPVHACCVSGRTEEWLWALQMLLPIKLQPTYARRGEKTDQLIDDTKISIYFSWNFYIFYVAEWPNNKQIANNIAINFRIHTFVRLVSMISASSRNVWRQSVCTMSSSTERIRPCRGWKSHTNRSMHKHMRTSPDKHFCKQTQILCFRYAAGSRSLHSCGGVKWPVPNW